MQSVFVAGTLVGCFANMFGNNPFGLSTKLVEMSKPALRKLEGPVLSQVEGLNPCPNRQDQ
jgi:hypothetical protein